MDEEIEAAMSGLRHYMFDNVYTNSVAKQEDKKAQALLKSLYEYYLEHTEELPEEYFNMIWISREPVSRVVCDYVAGMTDGYAIDTYQRLFVPVSWKY